MMNNEDRDFNRTNTDIHIHKGVSIGHHLVHNHVDTSLRFFEKKIQLRDLGTLYLLETILKDEIRLLRCLEHDSLTEHYAIHEMELFRKSYINHEELFREAKSSIRVKIRLLNIYIDKEWNKIESANRRED